MVCNNLIAVSVTHARSLSGIHSVHKYGLRLTYKAENNFVFGDIINSMRNLELKTSNMWSSQKDSMCLHTVIENISI